MRVESVTSAQNRKVKTLLALQEKARLRNVDDPVVPARLMLADAARRILCDGLSILGIIA